MHLHAIITDNSFLQNFVIREPTRKEKETAVSALKGHLDCTPFSKGQGSLWKRGRNIRTRASVWIQQTINSGCSRQETHINAHKSLQQVQDMHKSNKKSTSMVLRMEVNRKYQPYLRNYRQMVTTRTLRISTIFKDMGPERLFVYVTCTYTCIIKWIHWGFFKSTWN